MVARVLPRYQGASPVRIGNAASEQLQLDVYGEVMGELSIARHAGLAEPETAWPLQVRFIEHLESIWDQPDDGIWEVRGARRHFTHSKVMAWLAVDRALRDAEIFGMPAPVEHWRALRDHMHEVICEKGFNKKLNSFTQSFGDTALDASLLLIPQVNFLPASDPRVAGTIDAIERNLLVDGFVLRYRTETGADGFRQAKAPSCHVHSGWQMRMHCKDETTNRTPCSRDWIGLANDVGLLSEEYDPKACRLVGNTPQAFSHLALIGTALNMQHRGLADQHEKGEE